MMLTSISPSMLPQPARQMLLRQQQQQLPMAKTLPIRLPSRLQKVVQPGKPRTLVTTRHLAAAPSSHSGRSEPQVGSGVRFASLPVSHQAISMAFQVLDKDDDGRINRGDAYRLVAYYLALQHHKPPSAQRRPLTFDQHLLSSISTASKLTGGSWTGIAASCEAFVGAKLAGGLQAHPPRCSDIVWGAAGMAAAVLVLGVLAAAAGTLPVVGPLHQQGVPLLLGSFGTLAILLFGKPEAEPVRLWSVIAGQLGATAIVMAVLHVWGASLASRAAAMAATVAWQMWTDCIHPPGGALVLMAMDNAAIQQVSWAYLLYPSLLLSVCVLLPIAAATNWLRRNYQFDAPWAAGPGAATLRQKAREFKQQQAAKQAAVVRQWRALELDRGGVGVGQQELHQELHSPLSRLARLLRPILQLLSFPRRPQQQRQQQPQRWGYITTSTGERLQVRGISLDLGPGLNLGQSSTDAGSAEAAAAAALKDAIRQRLIRQEQDRQFEDKLHRQRVWGGSEQTPDLKKFSERLEDVHQQQQRMQEGGDKGPVLPPVGWNQQLPGLGDQQQQKQQKQQQQQHREGEEGEVPLVSPRQRLEQHWEQGAELQASSSRSSSRLGLRSSSSPEQQQQQQGDEEK